MATRTVQSVADAGSKPRGLVLDDRGQQLLMLSDGPPVKGPANNNRPGELRVIRGAAPSAPIPVGTSPERLELSADGKTLYALGTNSVAKVTMADLKPAPPLTFKVWGEELRVSPDGTRLYMVNGEYFKTFDLATGAQLTEVRTGRMSMKLLQALENGPERRGLAARGRERGQARGPFLLRLHGVHTDAAARHHGHSSRRQGRVCVEQPDRGSHRDRRRRAGRSSRRCRQEVSPCSSCQRPRWHWCRRRLPCMRWTCHAPEEGRCRHRHHGQLRPGGTVARRSIGGDPRSGGVLLVDATSGRPVGTFKALAGWPRSHRLGRGPLSRLRTRRERGIGTADQSGLAGAR